MKLFFIVGPTSVGKSEIAAEVAARMNAEIVSADAYQIYRGLDLLSAKPDKAIRARATHHLIGAVPPGDEMSAVHFRGLADAVFDDIRARGKNAIVVSGSGLYIRALTDGLVATPAADPKLRAALSELSLSELNTRLRRLDPVAAKTIDAANPRRVTRAIEICLLSGQPASLLRDRQKASPPAAGVLLLRERDDLYRRINARVEQMFAAGVVEEVRTAGPLGPTAEQTLGLREIRQLLAGEMTGPQCITAIQQATRRYAKRQLTWFTRQTNFKPLNLSERTAAEAIEWITQKARLSFAHD